MLSLNSKASFLPVEAPLGTEATPIIPDSRVTSTSTVGFPLESNISLAYIFFYFAHILSSIIIIKYMSKKVKKKKTLGS